MLISIVIRTLNEATHLADLLGRIETQHLDPHWQTEVIIVDSGSTDGTLQIAGSHGCRITHICEADFSFGRSLNQGCGIANGTTLVFISGHCVPLDNDWLRNLVKPLLAGTCIYCYGRQIGAGATKYSESQVFQKYYPASNLLPQSGFFANNANAALPRSVWEAHGFDESLTGLEDMHLAKKLATAGGKIGYSANASVYHLHDESWAQILHRYEREGAALADIMPETGLSFFEFLRFTVRSIVDDCRSALGDGVLGENLMSIVLFRLLQYWGSYRGTRFARMVASMRRKTYFHPNRQIESPLPTSHHESDRTTPPQSTQQPSAGQKLPPDDRQTPLPVDPG